MPMQKTQRSGDASVPTVTLQLNTVPSREALPGMGAVCPSSVWGCESGAALGFLPRPCPPGLGEKWMAMCTLHGNVHRVCAACPQLLAALPARGRRHPAQGRAASAFLPPAAPLVHKTVVFPLSISVIFHYLFFLFHFITLINAI